MSAAIKVPFVDLERVHKELSSQLSDAYNRVVGAGSFIQGKEAEAFEKEWSAYCGVPHTIGCANGTDALQLILMALRIGPGDEVITVSNTFFATVESIVAVGATPIMVDVSLTDGLIDVALVEKAINSRTKAILTVHLYGNPCDLAALKKITEARGIHLIEDAAQGHGALYDGVHVGGFGIAAAFSFFPGKNLGALGDAGAVVTRDQGLAETIRSLCNHGRGPNQKYSHQEFGYNMRIDGLQAAFLRAKLPHLSQWINDRRAVAAIYNSELKDLSEIPIMQVSKAVTHAYHLFVIRNDDREGLAKKLNAQGVSTGVHYPLGCHEQPAWKEKRKPISLPNTEKISKTCLSLPIFGGMREDEARRVVQVIKELFH